MGVFVSLGSLKHFFRKYLKRLRKKTQMDTNIRHIKPHIHTSKLSTQCGTVTALEWMGLCDLAWIQGLPCPPIPTTRIGLLAQVWFYSGTCYEKMSETRVWLQQELEWNNTSTSFSTSISTTTVTSTSTNISTSKNSSSNSRTSASESVGTSSSNLACSLWTFHHGQKTCLAHAAFLHIYFIGKFYFHKLSIISIKQAENLFSSYQLRLCALFSSTLRTVSHCAES